MTKANASDVERERELLRNLLPDLEFDLFELEEKYAAERDKRLRKDGNAQFIKLKDDFANLRDDPWVKPDHTREPVKDHTHVIVVGAGFGGMVSSVRLRQQGIEDLRVIDIAADFGGTWYWNRYPGIMCDIEGHCYLPLLEETGYVPKTRYPYGSEIQDHSQNIAKKYRLYDKALLQTKVTELRFDENENRWHISTNHNDELTADYIVLATGGLSLPKLPGLPGIHDFKGKIFHTARWDFDCTGGDSFGGMTKLKDKKVGVIGTGATALQVVPQLGDYAEQVYVFQRTPSSVGIRGQCQLNSNWADMSEPGWHVKRMENFTKTMAGIWQDVDQVRDGWTEHMRRVMTPATSKAIENLDRDLTPEELGLLMRVSDARNMNLVRQRVKECVKDDATAEALMPWYRWACKRPGWHDEYLDSFNKDNVTLVDTLGQGVERMTEKGAIVDGKEYELDLMVFATGFEVRIPWTERAGFDLIGRNGRRLSEYWKKGIRTWQGTMSDGFPNCLFVGSVQQSAGTINFTHMITEHSTHVAYIISEADKRGAKTVEPEVAAVDEYVKLVKDGADENTLEFYKQCTPGYYNAEGQADSDEDLFFGGKYNALAYFDMIHDWQNVGDMAGLTLGK